MPTRGAGMPSADGSPAPRHLPDVANILSKFENFASNVPRAAILQVHEELNQLSELRANRGWDTTLLNGTQGRDRALVSRAIGGNWSFRK